MAYPIFYVPAGDVLPILFASYDKDDGSSITLTGLAVTDIEIYKDGSVTQRASDAGFTLLDTDGIDFDGITGIHGFSIDTGDNTDASFYTVGAWFHVVVSAVTIDAVAVSFIAAAFRIMKAESIAGVPKADVDAWLGSAAATPSVAGVPEVDLTHVAGATTNVAALATNVDAILTDTNELQTDWANGGRLDLILDIIAADTTTDIPATLATIAGYLDTEIAAIMADTNELQTDWANGGRLDLLIDAIKAVTDLLTAAHSEPTGVPAADETPLDKLAYLYMALRNKVTVTATKKQFFDDGGTAEWEKDLSDDGTTYTETEGNAP